MFPVDPMTLIQMIRQGKNPQQLMMQMLEGNMGSTPMGQNLIQLIKKNDSKGVEGVVRNVYQTQGMDYDQAFNVLTQMLGLK